MPIYVYQVILEDGIEGPTFEYRQAANDQPLKTHPVTGHEVRRVIQAPNVISKYSEVATKQKLDNKNLEKAGFTKYERDKSSGVYHKVAGKGPETLKRSDD